MDCGNQSHNQHRHQQQHRRQAISSDALPAFPCSSLDQTCVHSTRLCGGRRRTTTTTTSTATVTGSRTRTTPPPTPTSFGFTVKSSAPTTSSYHPDSYRRVQSSRPCGSSFLRLPIVLFQLILVLSTFVVNEAQVDNSGADDRSMMQWSIGDFQLDLKPTPETLYNVDNIVGPSIERVVRTAMEHEFGGTFLYMYVAGLSHVLEQPATGRQGQEEPMTSLFYNGGVVNFQTPAPSADINAIVKSSLEANLTQELAPHGESWALIQSITFNSLRRSDNGDTGPDDGPPAPGVGPISTLRPSPPPSRAPTSAPQPPTGGASAIEGDGDITNTSQSEAKSSAPQIVASGFGIAFVMIGVTLLVKATRKRRTHVREVALSLEEADSEASVEGGRRGEPKDPFSQDLDGFASATPTGGGAAQRGYLSPPTSTRSRNSRASSSRPLGVGGDGDSAAYIFEDNTDDEDRSEMAQYSTGEWMESTSAQSVTSSDFTLTTVDDATYSALADNSIGRHQQQQLQHSPQSSSPSSSRAHPDTSSRVAVMGFASSETFERDRLVTLHKDMLQSEWGTPLAAHGHITYATNINTSRPTTPGGGVGASMSFEEAYQGDGDRPREEVFILPPPPSTTSRGRKKNDLKE